jgi:hypothetical protein
LKYSEAYEDYIFFKKKSSYVLRQKLLFPTPTATAIAIQRLHSGPEGEETGKKQVRCLGLAFTGAMSLRVLSQYLPGIVWKWHWGWWLYLMGKIFRLIYLSYKLAKENSTIFLLNRCKKRSRN